MASSLPVVFIMGATASGKTSVAMDLVTRLEADIVSVDSAMIYTGMDIGTAKPTVDELARAPHALIDILDPSESWSAGSFCEAARVEIARSHERGRVPLLTGGTMLYFRALELGLNDLPRADDRIRREIDEMADSLGWPAVHAELARYDPATAARVHENDSQRIQRALEVFRITGTPMSELQSAQSVPLEYPLIKCVLHTTDRATLHGRIHRRFDQMLEAGLLGEVERLYARGDLTADLPSIRSVGYRQLWAHLEGKTSLAEATERAKTATRQLAKRQMTWIRSQNNVVTYEAGTSGVSKALQAQIAAVI